MLTIVYELPSITVMTSYDPLIEIVNVILPDTAPLLATDKVTTLVEVFTETTVAPEPIPVPDTPCPATIFADEATVMV